MKAQIGDKVPELVVDAWVQGQAVTLAELSGQVVLLEFFQVNCPGCFIYALPQAIELYERYAPQGLVVLGIATAFEDFDKNNLANLQLLLQEQRVIGEAYKLLAERDYLVNERWPHRLPFPVAWDQLSEHAPATDADIERFIAEKIPLFLDESSLRQAQIRQQVEHYFQQLQYKAESFSRFNLKGTPSQVLIDKQGIISATSFGQNPELEASIQKLLADESE